MRKGFRDLGCENRSNTSKRKEELKREREEREERESDRSLGERLQLMGIGSDFGALIWST